MMTQKPQSLLWRVADLRAMLDSISHYEVVSKIFESSPVFREGLDLTVVCTLSACTATQCSLLFCHCWNISYLKITQLVKTAREGYVDQPLQHIDSGNNVVSCCSTTLTHQIFPVSRRHFSVLSRCAWWNQTWQRMRYLLAHWCVKLSASFGCVCSRVLLSVGMTQKLFRNSFDTTSYVDGRSCEIGRPKLLIILYWYNCSSYLLCDWLLCSDWTVACLSSYCKGKYVVQITTSWELFLRKVIGTNQHLFICHVTNFAGTNFLPSTHFHGVQLFLHTFTH